MMSISKNSTTHSTLVSAIAALVIVFSTAVLSASQDQPERSTFNKSCASCHGKDGISTPVGKSLNAPDLNSPAVQSQSDAQLRQIISDGKGNMPPFKSSLSDAQIDSLVAYIRTLKQQK